MSQGSKRIGMAAVLAVAVLAAASSSRIRWRANLVLEKLQGERPASFLSWGDMLQVMRPPAAGTAGRYEQVLQTHIEAAQRGPEPCPVYWQTPVGGFWGRADERYILAFLLREQLVSRIYRREPVAVRPGDVVLDVGGHLGSFTRLSLEAGARLVVAFEPEPTNAACFERTFEQEIAAGRVHLLQEAAWEKAGALLLTPRMNNGAGTVIPGMYGTDSSNPGVSVRATTIDETVERLGLDRVDFIKMDIEGAERHALLGGRRTLKRFAPRMVLCIYHRSDDPEAVPEVVLKARPQYKSFRTREQVYFY